MLLRNTGRRGSCEVIEAFYPGEAVAHGTSRLACGGGLKLHVAGNSWCEAWGSFVMEAVALRGLVFCGGAES